MTTDTSTEPNFAPNWRHVGAFLGLTFGLTWLLDLAIYLRGGLRIPGIVAILQLQMLLPAFSAIVLGLFFFPESPIYRNRTAGRGRWFYYYFLLLTLIYAIGTLVIWLAPAQSTIAVLAAIPEILAFLGLLVLVVLRLIAGRQSMAQVWLAWGNGRYWLLFGLGFVAYYVLQAALNAFSGLGGANLAPPPAPPGLSPNLFLILATVQTVLLAPFLAIVIAFGEEYGWRGYLQSELFKMGRVRGVLLLGVLGFVLASTLGALAGVALGVFAPFAFLSRAAGRRLAAIQGQLADTLMVIASSMRAGHSFLQSLDSAAKEIDQPAAGEFGRVLREIRLGRDTDDALEALVERVGSQDLEWAVTAIKVQRKIGGNLAEVLETVLDRIDALLSAMPSLDGQRRARIRLAGEIPSAASPPAGCVFHTRCPRKLSTGVCETVDPPLAEVEPGHMMSCHIPVDELRRLQETPETPR